MYKLLTAACLSLSFTATAEAQQDISTEIRGNGLAATANRLQSLPSPTADEHFATGGVLFLRAVEAALQEQYRVGIQADETGLPILRMPTATNPTPEPFSPGDITRIFSTLVADMALSRDALGKIPTGEQVSLTIALDDLWFDVDHDGLRSEQESVVKLGLDVIIPPWQRQSAENMTAPTIRFDTADVAWLAAYTHLLSGVGELIQAFDPTDAIGRIQTATSEMNAMMQEAPAFNAMDMQFGSTIDLISMIYLALSQQPDANHTKAAHAHFLDMITQNRTFWAAVETEADNNAEWIPNSRQQSALGINVPADTSERWQAVLGDAEAILKGDALVPYWRFGAGSGININRMFMDPAPVDIVEWIQGVGLLPYAEQGPLITTENLQLFESMVAGDAMMFMVLLN